MTDENPGHDVGSIPPPPSRLPTSALPVIEVDAERATEPSAARSAGSAESSGAAGAAGAGATSAATPSTAKPAAGKATGTAFAGILTALSDRARPLARRVRPLVRRIRPLARKVRPLAGRIRRQGPIRLAVAAAILVALGLLVWWAVAAFAGTPQSSAEGGNPAPAAASEPTPASRGTLPLEGVSPLDFQPRDCFKDFDPDAQKSTIVDCATGHSAQLVAVEKYGADDSYPGREQLKQKARAACKATELTDKAGDYKLSYKLAYPSSSSWGKGDRRVDCYVVTDAGNVITKSLLP